MIIQITRLLCLLEKKLADRTHSPLLRPNLIVALQPQQTLESPKCACPVRLTFCAASVEVL